MAAQVESGFYNAERGLPWHKQGQAFPGFATAAEVLCAAGLDWTVSRRQLLSVNADGSTTVCPNHASVARDTDNAVFGVLGSRYVPVQNSEALTFLDSMVGLGEAVYDSAWSLRGGATVAISAKLGMVIKPAEGEDIDTYLTVTNDHSGHGQIKFIVSPVRVVCMNTLMMAINGAKFTWQKKHTTNALSAKSLDEAREALGVAAEYQERISEVAKALLGETFTDKKMGALAKALVIGDQSDPSEKVLLKAALLTDIYKTSPNLDNIRKTKWGALNAVAEWADYGQRYVGVNAVDNRTDSILGGRAADIKTMAYQLLTN